MILTSRSVIDVISRGRQQAGEEVGTNDTTLSLAAAGLGAEESANFSSGPSWLSSEAVTWQTATIYYDADLQLVHAVGKSAGVTAYSHFVYDEVSGEWGDNTISSSDNGHFWCTAFDPSEGAYYFAWAGGDLINKYVPGVGWSEIEDSPTSGYFAGIGWHPNLYGAGDGGLVVVANTITMAWRKSTGDWETIQSGLQNAGSNGGSGAYDSVNDKVWVGTGDSVRAVIVTAGSGGTVGSPSTPSDPPLGVYGGGDTSSTNKVIPHPYTAGKLLLLASESNSVYESTDSGSSWSLASYSHPFYDAEDNQWTCGPIPGSSTSYGVVWGLSSRGPWSKLWRPGA